MPIKVHWYHAHLWVLLLYIKSWWCIQGVCLGGLNAATFVELVSQASHFVYFTAMLCIAIKLTPVEDSQWWDSAFSSFAKTTLANNMWHSFPSCTHTLSIICLSSSTNSEYCCLPYHNLYLDHGSNVTLFLYFDLFPRTRPTVLFGIWACGGSRGESWPTPVGLPFPHHPGAPQTDPAAAEYEKEVPHFVWIFAGGVCICVCVCVLCECVHACVCTYMCVCCVCACACWCVYMCVCVCCVSVCMHVCACVCLLCGLCVFAVWVHVCV